MVFDTTGSVTTTWQSGGRAPADRGVEMMLGGSARNIVRAEFGITLQGLSGTIDLDAKIWANDGTNQTPSTVLWESSWRTVSISGWYQLVAFDVPHVLVPDHITLTIAERNSSTGAEYGEPLAYSTVAGSALREWSRLWPPPDGTGTGGWTQLQWQPPALPVMRLTAQTDLVWRATANNAWNTATANTNWSGPITYYQDGANVTFDDTVGAGSRNVFISGTVAPLSITVGGSGNYTLGGSGLIAGSSGIAKNGAGTLTISNAGLNTYSGGLNINGGTVQISGTAAATALGAATSTIAVNNGVLQVSAAGITSAHPMTLGDPNAAVSVDSGLIYTANGAVGGAGSLNATGQGTLVLGGTNTFSGQTIIQSGTVSVGVLAAAGTAQPLGQNANPVVVGTSTPYSTSNATLAYSGATVASALPFAIGSGGGAIAVTNSASTLTLTSALTGGSLTVKGPGTLVLSAANTYAGGTTVTGGTLQVNGASNLPSGPITLSGGSTLHFSQAGSVTQSISSLASTDAATKLILDPNVTLCVGGANSTTTVASAISGAGTLVKVGTGSLTLSSVNSFSGGLNIQSGTIRAGVNGAILGSDPVTFGGPGTSGTLDLNGHNVSVNGLSIASGAPSGSQLIGNSNILLNATLTYAGATSTFGGTIQDSLGSGTKKVALLVSGGNLALSGANTYSGGTTINSGATLTIANTTGSATGSNLVSVSGALAGNGTIAATAGGVTVNASGHLAPHSSASTTGLITITSGAAAALSLSTGASLDYNFGTGTNDRVTVNGNLALASGSMNLNITNLGGLHEGTYGLLNYSGSLSGGGGFNVNGGLTRYNYAVLRPTDSGGVANQISLLVSAKPAITWTGSSGSGGNANWDMNAASTNWTPGGAYVDYTPVIFSDSGANTNIAIPAGTTLSPAMITFNNNSVAYSIVGSGTLAGDGALTMNGTGLVTMTNANSYPGGTVINHGTIAVNNPAALGASSGALALNNDGQLRVTTSFTDTRSIALAGTPAISATAGVTYTANGSIGGTGDLNANSAVTGTIVLGGANTFAGQVKVNSGTVSLAILAAAGTAQPLGQNANPVVIGTSTAYGVTNATLAYSGATATSSLPITIGSGGGAVAVTNSASTLTLTGSLAGGALISSGLGTLVLAGSNTCTGGTIVQNGTLRVGTNNALPVGSSVAFGSATTNGTLDLGGFNAAVGGLAVAAAVLGGSLSSQRIGNSGSIDSLLTFTNTTTPSVFAGTIQDGLGSGIHKTGLTVSASSSLTLSGTNIYTGPTSVSGTLTVLGSLGNTPVTIDHGGTLLLAGAGTRTLAGSLINNGILQAIGTDASLAGVVTNSSLLQLQSAHIDLARLANTTTGYLQAGDGDALEIAGDFLSTSTQNLLWQTADAELGFHAAGPASHLMSVTGTDLLGYGDNFAWGRLALGPGQSLVLEDGDATPGGAIYTKVFYLADGLGQIAGIHSNGLNIYYDPSQAENDYLGRHTYALDGGGQLAPALVPLPSVVCGGLVLLGGLACGRLLRRRAARRAASAE